jgi:hypothetical protein
LRIVTAEFLRLTTVPVPALVGAVGVYCIWDGRARAKPTYIGEGTILTRLSQHAGRFSWPFDGYVAITGDWSQAKAKSEAEILEAVLLYVAADTDRLPTQNRAPGKTTGIRRTFKRHGVLRINIKGLDPLLRPEQSRPFAGSKVATLRYIDDSLPPFIEHDWRLRRLQT